MSLEFAKVPSTRAIWLQIWFIAVIMASLISKRPLLGCSWKPISSFVARSHTIDQTTYLFEKTHFKTPLSKKEYLETKCITVEKFAQRYCDLLEKEGINVEEGYQRMVDRLYLDYCYHLKIIEPGRLF